MDDLISFYNSHEGKITDKWTSCIHHYDDVFKSWRKKPVRLLEIGIQNGGSLEIWAQYFTEGLLFVGCDINPRCGQLTFNDPRIAMIICDICTDEAKEKIKAYAPAYDLIIDDGSHHSGHIIEAFARYFPLLEDGGLYIVEDLHCSFWQAFQGGLADPFSSIAFFKRLADLIHHEHWGVSLQRCAYLEGFSRLYQCHFDEASLSKIHSVEFINSMCIIKKRHETKNVLGSRLVKGNLALVSDNVKFYDGTSSVALDQTHNCWSSPILFDLTDHHRLIVGYISMENRAIFVEEQLKEQSDQIMLQLEQIIKLKRQIKNLSENVVLRDRIISDIASDMLHKNLQIEQIAHEQQEQALLASQNEALKSTESNIGPSWRKLRLHNVIKGLFKSLASKKVKASGNEQAIQEPSDYEQWIQKNEPTEDQLQEQRNQSPPYDPMAPLFSLILPIYKISARILTATITSILEQTWQNWELCIAYADVENLENWRLLQDFSASDPRIQLSKLVKNRGISENSNAALALARGEFIALLDHDDELTSWALYEMATKINEYPEADFLYSDKDSIDEHKVLRQNPLFKPQWSPEMLYSVNYLTHFNVMRRVLVLNVGGFRSETDGAQDWDIFLRVTEQSRRIEHVPSVHYHWRIIPGSTSTGIGAKPYALLGQLKTIESRVKRLGLHASVLPSQESGFQLRWHINQDNCVDLILHGDAPTEYLSPYLKKIFSQEQHLFASITIISRSSFDLASIQKKLPLDIPLHQLIVRDDLEKSSAIEETLQKTKAPVILLFDLSIMHMAKNTLSELTGWALLHPDIAFVTPLILLKDNTVAEAGRIKGDNLQTLPFFHQTPLYHYGPLGGPLWFRNVSCCSSTAVAFKRDAWHVEQDSSLPWPQAFTKFCEKALRHGRRGLVTPHARVVLKSYDEQEPLCAWDDSFRKDPYFNPAFSSIFPLTMDKSSL